MRLMILRAALFAADAELAAGAQDVQTSAPGQPAIVDGLEKLAEPESADPATVHADGSVTHGDQPAAIVQNAGQIPRDSRPAPMGAPVIVRQGEKLAPGIVVEEDDGEGSGITVQIFRGDHMPHVGHHLQRTTRDDTSDGWFYPWERASL